MPSWLTEYPRGIVLDIYVQPGARRTEPAGEFDGLPKVRLAAPPRDNAANDELVRYLARALDVPRSSVSIVSGQRSRRKRVSISGEGLARPAENLLAIPH